MNPAYEFNYKSSTESRDNFLPIIRDHLRKDMIEDSFGKNKIIDNSYSQWKNTDHDGAEFSVRGNDHAADSRVTMLYEDLKVAALEKDKGSSELDTKALSSFIANIVIKNANPKGNNDVRVAQLHLDRNTNSSFFNFSWKTIFKGIKETVGLK